MNPNLIENNFKEYLTPLQARKALNMKKKEFYSFVMNRSIRECAPATGGKKTNKTKILYKTSELIDGYQSYSKSVLTLKEAMEVTNLKRTTLLNFIRRNNIKPFMPLGGDRKSGTVQRWIKEELFAAIDNSRVHSDIPTHDATPKYGT